MVQIPTLGELSSIVEDPASQPYVHPNGFIQLNLTDDRRVRAHFWGHPSIPKQKVATPIHDHVYSFESRVLKGRLFNIRYTFRSGLPETHQVYEWSKELSKLIPQGTDWRVSPVPVECLCMTPVTGAYREEPHEFHETFVDRPTITIVNELKKSDKACAAPRILVPVPYEPDNDFQRDGYGVQDIKSWIREIFDHG